MKTKLPNVIPGEPWADSPSSSKPDIEISNVLVFGSRYTCVRLVLRLAGWSHLGDLVAIDTNNEYSIDVNTGVRCTPISLLALLHLHSICSQAVIVGSCVTSAYA